MEQIIKQNTFSRTVFNDSKLGAYYTDPVHATKIGRLFRLQGECCVLEPSFGNAEALKAFLSQCERADEVGSVHTFGVELNRETFEQYKQEIEFPVCADFIGGIRASNRSFTLCFANPPYGVGGDDGSTRLERLFVERIFQLMKTKGYLVLVVSLTTMNLDEFAKSLLARFKPVAFYRFDDEEFAKYKQVVFIGQKRASIGLYRKEYEEWMSTNPGAPLENIPYIPKDPDTRIICVLEVKFTISANWQNVWNDARQRVLRSRRLRKMSVPGSWVIRAIYMYRYQKMAMITSYTIPIFQSGMAARWIRMAP